VRELIEGRDLTKRLSRPSLDLHPDQVVEVDLVLFRRRQLRERRQEITPTPQLGAITVAELLELYDQAFLEWFRRLDREGGSVAFAADSARNGEIPLRVTRKNTTAGREDHVRLTGERLDDDLSAYSLGFADQPDDRVLGLSHFPAVSYAPAGASSGVSFTGMAVALCSIPSRAS
jgi:hypothetical protein